ncbi:MAG: SagB/ThcOx family dehydrogenase [Bacteroidetes bacterium]|nr:SagB/ThcOx family dehydrogenase [Bacteroidota bacterium]
MLLAQSPPTITLPTPDTTGGMPIMKAFALRASERVFDTTALPIQKLSNLLWAANGINRPGERKRTAPSALNAQDIDIYVFLSNGVYLYDANQHVLIGVVEGDHRQLFSRSPGSDPIPPVLCLLVSDISRFRFGVDSARRVWAAMDAGIVSQNISLYCASAGLATRPRAMMNHQKVRELLHLKDTHIPMLNLPISQKLGREQPK